MEVCDTEDHHKALKRILQIFHAESGTEQHKELQNLVSAVEWYEHNREMERLQRLGISGSAIRPNLKGNKDWEEEQSKILQDYDLKVEKKIGRAHV